MQLLLVSLLALAISARGEHLGQQRHGRRAIKPLPYTKAFKMIQDYSGTTFFDGFDFFSSRDPTNGLVKYQTAKEAARQTLAYVDRKTRNAILAVDSKTNLPAGGYRNSTRITSKQTFNKGQLLIIDALHMPTGCATWPAAWLVGPDWPNGGEVDIVEGVNTGTRNQITLHTSDGCTLKTPMNGTGSVVTTNCYALAPVGNLGCGIKAPNGPSFGAPFNKAKGGAYATLWDDTGFKVWFWTRNAIPADVKAGRPAPSTWGTPVAFFSSDTCSASFFKPQTIVINTTLCGDWAGSDGVYGNGDGCPGTCAKQVQTGSNFKQAYWEIASVRVYA